MAYDIELTPKITDESGLLDLEKRIKEIEDKGIDLKLKMPELNDSDNKKLLSQIKTINKFSEELQKLTGDSTKIEKTIELNVDVDDVSAQIVRGLKVLDKLNPDDSKFMKSLQRYKKLQDETDALFNEDFSKKNNFKSFDNYITSYKNKVNELYSVTKDLEKWLEKDSTLMSRLGDGTFLTSSVDYEEIGKGDVADKFEEGIEKLKSRVQIEIDGLNSKIKSAQATIARDEKMISGKEDEEGPFVKSIKKEIAASEKAITEYQSKIEEAKQLQQKYDQYVKDFSYTPHVVGEQQVDTNIEQVAIKTSKSLKAVSEADKELEAALNGVSTDSNTVKEMQKTTESAEQAIAALTDYNNTTIDPKDKFSDVLETNLRLLTSFVKALNNSLLVVNEKMNNMTADWIEPMKNSMEKVEAVIKKMQETTREIKFPFDEESISNVASKFDTIFQQFSQFDGEEKTIKLNITVNNEELLEKAAQAAKAIQDAVKLVPKYEAITKAQNAQNQKEEEKKSAPPEQTSGVVKKKKKKDDKPSDEPSVLEATNKAVAAYEKLEPKTVKITLDVENFDELQTTVGYIKEIDKRNKHIAEDAVTKVAPKIKSGVYKPSENTPAGSGSGQGGNNNSGKPIDPNISPQLQTITTGLNSIFEKTKEAVTKLESISKKIPSSEAIVSVANKLSEQVQAPTVANESSKKPLVNDGTENNNIEAIRIIGEGVKNSTNLLSQAVDDFDGFCRRFLLRFPLPQNGSDTSATNVGSSNDNGDEPNGGAQTPSGIASSVEGISQKSDDIIKKLTAIQKKIPTAKSMASEITTVLNQPQSVENESESSIPVSKSSDNEGDDSDDTILTQINTNIGNVAQNGEDIVKKLTAIQKKIPTVKSMASEIATVLNQPKPTETETESPIPTNNLSEAESDDPDDTVLTKINTSIGDVVQKGDDILKKLTAIQKKIPTVKSLANAKTESNTASNQSDGDNSENQSLLSTLIDPKLGAIQASLANIDGKIVAGGSADDNANNQTPPSVSNEVKNIDSNVSEISNAVKEIGGKVAEISNKTSSDAQNTQNTVSAPSPAQAAANLTNVSSLKTQADNRIQELRRVFGILSNGSFSSIFGSTQDIQSYINSLDTLNKEIASAGRILSRTDITETQRKSAENIISNNSAILNGYINGDDSLGISSSQIANINALLNSMQTINDRLGNTDSALESLKRLKETLNNYNISVQPLEDAINNLKSTKDSLKQMSDKISSSSLTEGELSNLQTAITSAETNYQSVIDESNKLLDTDQNDSLKNIINNFTQAETEVDKYKKKIYALKDILTSLKSSNHALDTFDMGNGRSAKDLQEFINNYERFLNANKNITDVTQMQNFATNFANNYQTPLKAYVNSLDDAQRKLKEMNQATQQAMQSSSFDKRLADMTTRVEKWRNANGKALGFKEYSDEYQRILTALTNGSTTSDEQLKRLQADFALLTLRANQAGVATKSFTTKLKEMYKKYGGWTLVTKTMNTAMRLLRSMVTQVKEVDTAMTNLKKVTEATGNQLNTFLESAGKRSVALGASLTDYVDAVSEFSRLGKSLDEAQKLGELATTYKTVAEDLDIKTASKSIISTMQAFNGVGVQADEIVDKFNYVGNNFAASSAEVGESLQRSAAALNGAENSLSESIGLTVSAQTVVQNAETVGTALKTISARIRGTTSDLGDDADDIVITTSKLRKEIKALSGVDIEENGNLKSTYQILKEISEVYDTLSDSSQSRINELLGGKVGINTIQAILTNFETAEKIVDELDSGLAKGSASKELEKSLDSIQGKLNQLKSTWQQLSTDFLDTGLIKGGVDGIKGLISLLDVLTKHIKNFGAIYASVFAGIAANKAVKNSIGGSILGITNKRLDFLTGIQPQSLPGYYKVKMDIDNIRQARKNGDNNLDTLTNLSAEMREYAKNTDSANMSVSNFYATQTKSAKGFLGSVQAIKTYNNLTRPEQRLAFADAVAVSNKELGNQMKQLRGNNASAAIYFKTLKTGVKELGAKVFSGITTGLVNMVASLAIGALIQGIKWISESYDRMIEKNAELSKSFKETTDEIKSDADEINSLMSQYSNIIVTTSDLSTAQTQLIEIQEQLAESLGIEKEKLDLVGNSYAKNIKLIQERRKAMADEFVEETKNLKQYEDAKKYLEESSVAHWETGFNGDQYLRKEGNYSAIEASGYGDWNDDKEAYKTISKYKNIDLSQYQNTLYVEGTVDEQIETLEALNKELTKLWGNKPSSANEHEWLKNIQERIDILKEEKKTAEELIEKIDELNNINKIDDKTYSDIEKIEKVVEKLQSAENAKDIIEASNSYRQLKEEIYSAVGEDDTETRGLLDTYFEAIEKNIDQSILDINNNVTILEKVLKKFQDETYEKFTGKITKLDSAIKSISAGDSIDESSMNELIKMDALTLEDFQKTADGYTVSLENLIEVRAKYIKEQKDDIRDTLEEENQLYEDQLAQIEQLEKEYRVPKFTGYDKTGQAVYTDPSETKIKLDELKKAAEETSNRIKAWQAYDRMISEDIAELQDEIYENIESKVGKISSAIKTLSSGEYLDAATLLELGKIDSTLLGQFQKSVEGYTLSIDKLYEVRKKLIESQKKDIEQEIAYTEKVIATQENLISGYDANGFKLSEETVLGAKADKKEAEERLEYLRAYLELLGQNTDAVSLFQQSLSDTKGLRDNIASLYSDEGLDSSFFADHPELLKYKGDVEKLGKEIQKLARAKSAPILKELNALMLEAKANGDTEAVEKYLSMINQLKESSDLKNTINIEKQKKNLRDQIEAKERYIKALERQKDKEQKILDTLNEQKEALEKLISDYETAADTVGNYVDDMISDLDDEIDRLEEHKNAIEEDYDARIQAIQDEIDARDKEADALEKQAELQSLLNDLKEKELALEKAKNTKVRVYDATRGWRIEADREAVAQAQKEYDDALAKYNKQKKKDADDAKKQELENLIKLLEQEKEAALAAVDEQIKGIEAQKAELEEYKKMWEDMVKSYQKMQDEMTTAAVLGFDWREKIANQDIGILQAFGDGYSSLQSQLHTVVEPQIKDVENVISSYEKQIQTQNDLKSAQESYLSYYEKYSNSFVDFTDAQTAALNRLQNAITNGDAEGALDAELGVGNAFANGVQDNSGTRFSSKLAQLLSTGQTDKANDFLSSVPLIGNMLSNMITGPITTAINNSPIAEAILKKAAQKDITDNRSININNPVFDSSGTYEQFTNFLNYYFEQLDKSTKVRRN